MGISKLHSFMKNKDCCWRILHLKQGSQIVIDGSGLCYALHNDIESGEYCQFYKRVLDYFSFLNKNGIEAYVVINGIDYESKKMETRRFRDGQSVKRLWDANSDPKKLESYKYTISYMAEKVFIDAVRDSRVKYFVADGEGDRDVVSLANTLKCPVFGLDSDFYVFNIEGGFIPMNDDSGILVNLNGTVRCFLYRLFDSAYNLSGTYPRLPIAYCRGNDFHDSNAFRELGIERDASVGTVVSKCRGIQSDDFQKIFQEDYTFYHVEPCTFEVLAQSNTLCKFPIPEWIVRQFKKGLFSAVSIELLVSDNKTWRYTLAIEDLSRDSASKVIDSVLPYVVGALLSCEETRRFVRVCRKSNSTVLEKSQIDLYDDHVGVLGSYNLENAPHLFQFESRKIFLEVFHCTSVCRKLQQVPDDLKLVVIASRCWFHNINEEIDSRFNVFIRALVFSAKKCLRGSPNVKGLTHNAMGRLHRIHYLAQWEYMFHLALIFNQILGYPFYYVGMGRFFSKSVFQQFFTDSPHSLPKFDEEGAVMFEVITKDLLPYGPVQEVERQRPSLPMPAISTQNRFHLLSEC